MITIDNTTRAVHECTASYEVQQGKETVTEQIRVRYYGFTIAQIKDQQSRIQKAAAGEVPWLSELLAERLESLPDLQLPGGKEFKITVDNLDKLDLRNLNSIQKAVQEDLTPKDQPPKSPNG